MVPSQVAGQTGARTDYAYPWTITATTQGASQPLRDADFDYNDAFGNLVAVVEPDPATGNVPPPAPSYPLSSAPPNTLLTSYTYDALNHLTQVSMPRMVGGVLRTQTRTFVYDPTTQRLTSATNPENGTVTYAYNADGTLASKTDAKNHTESYSYDSYGRLSGIPDRGQTFGYDTNAPGMLTQVSFASGVGPNQLSFQYNYTYTPAGQVASQTLSLQSANHLYNNQPASGSVTASYTYDNQGVAANLALTGASSLTYALDALERPTGLTDSNGSTWVSGVSYNAANQLVQASFPLGTESWSYNSLLQVTQRKSGGGSRLNMQYNYTAGANNGQIANSVDGLSGETVTYQYDALKRLLSASAAAWSES
jgi:YD repeat-containing protein